jgi:hypothetical protein
MQDSSNSMRSCLIVQARMTVVEISADCSVPVVESSASLFRWPDSRRFGLPVVGFSADVGFQWPNSAHRLIVHWSNSA